MAEVIEIWKDIPENEGYQASELGNIRSVNRIILTENNQIRNYKGKQLKQSVNELGYLFAKLGLLKTPFKIHVLIAITFLDKDYRLKGLVVDHKDGNPKNNNLQNLRLITQHENSIYKKRRISKSGEVGVSIAENGKHRVSMYLNKKHKHIGYFNTLSEAKYAYKYALKIYKNIEYEF